MFTNVGGTVYFRANDGTSGYELWKSDGTEAGTVLVKDISIGSASSSLANVTSVGGTLYFTANDGTSGVELWKCDGTEAGTVRVKDIRAGTPSSNPSSLTNVAGTLYFTAYDGTSGVELWKSDGTEAGTVRVKDIWIGTSSSNPSSLVTVGGSLYFTANDGAGVSLWRCDGSEAGTAPVANFAGKFTIGNPSWLTEANGRLFVVATASHYGSEIWVADLTTDPLAGEYNSNGKVDAADYVLWRHTLGSTTDLRANGSTVGISAGVIDQSDYNVWRSTFGNPVPVSDPGAGAGVDENPDAASADVGSLKSTLQPTVFDARSVELGMGSGEGVMGSCEWGVGNGDSVNQMAVAGGDSPSPPPSPGGGGGIAIATRRAGRFEAAIASEPDLLLLLSAGMCDGKSKVSDALPLASADLAATSAEVADLAALDVAFAGVGQSGVDDWNVGG